MDNRFYFWESNCFKTKYYPDCEHLSMDELMKFMDTTVAYYKENPDRVTMPYQSSFPHISINITSRSSPPDYFQCGSYKFVSKTLKDAIELFPFVGVEFISITLLHKGIIYEKQPYYVLNVLDVSDCIDYEKSEIIWSKYKDIGKIKRLAQLKSFNSNGKHLFVLSPKPTKTLLSQEMIDKFREIKATGCLYVPFEEYNDFWMFSGKQFIS